MTKELKEIAEKALKQIIVGSLFDGIKFGLGLVLFFKDYDTKVIKSLWIRIESEFSVKQSSVVYISKGLTQEEEKFLQLFSLRGKKVVDITLGDISPHLFIEFESGEVLFINGFHNEFESWQAGDSVESDSFKNWLFVATPGNGISIWSPKELY